MKNKVDKNELYNELEEVLLNSEDEDELNEDELINEHDSKEESVSEVFSSYMKTVGKYQTMTPEEEKEKFTLYNNLPNGAEKMAVKEEIYHRNLKLVISIAKKFNSVCTSMTIMDVIMEGNIGLMTAINRFDVEKGYKFSTYATWWIRQSILRSIYNRDNTIRIPVHVLENDYKIQKEIEKCKTDGTPVPQELINSLSCNSGIKHVASLDKKINVEGSHSEADADCLLDILADEEGAFSVEDAVFQSQLHEIIMDIIDDDSCSTVFKPREKEIIIRRFGLNGNPPETLQEIADTMNLSRERVRQIEVKAIRKFRSPQNKRRLADFI